MHGGGKVGTMRDRAGQCHGGRVACLGGGGSMHRLASDSSLSWMGMTAREGSKSSQCRAPVIHSLPPPAPMGLQEKGGYGNKGAPERTPNLSSTPITIWI